MGLLIRSESGRVAGRTTVGSPLVLVAEPFAYVFTEDERSAAEVIAANMTASFGEKCEVVSA